MSHRKDGTTRCLDIVRQIRVHNGAYSQFVQCRVDGIQGPLVAKIFDPLYSSDDVELDEGQSPVGLTESEWSREAAAYAKIKEEGLDGRYTPRFEGCWSFDMPYELELVSNRAAGHVSTADTTTGGRQSGRSGERRHGESSDELVRRTIKVTRNVYLLLMEYIPGNSIIHLLKLGNYKKIPAKVRIDLVAQVAKAESALWHIRVSHGDRYSRNVVVCARKKKKRTSLFLLLGLLGLLLLLFNHHHLLFLLLLPLGKRRRRGPKWTKARTTRTRRPGVACGVS